MADDDTAPMANAYAQTGGAPDDYWARMTWIESRGNPNAARPGSQYKGIAQLGNDERQQYGVTDWTDPAQQRRAVDQIYNRNGKFFSNTFGRPPTDAEQYLMHNQGAHGLSQMMSNPDDNAASTVGFSHISGNWPQTLHGLDPRTISNRDYVKGWTDFYNGAPSDGRLAGNSTSYRGDPARSLGNAPMSNDYLAQALSGQNPQPVDQGPILNALRTFAGQPQGGGMSPVEKAGIYLMSISNPSALQGLNAGNRDAEARNANALRAIGLMMQQRNQDRQDKRLEGQLAPKSIYGTPQDQQGAPAAPIYDGGTQGGSGGGNAPAAPAAAPGSNIYGLADLQQIAAGSAQGDNEPSASPQAMAFAPQANGSAPPQAPTGWNNYNPDNPAVAQNAQGSQGGGGYGQQRLPSQADFDIAASRMRADIANGMKPEDVLGRIHDQGLRELVKSWGEGGLNPDSTNRQYDPQTKAARSLAAAIYGDKGIEEAWKRTQQETGAYADAMKVNVAGSVASKLNAMDNLHSVLFAGDDKNLGLTSLYDKLQNKQLDSGLAAYGLRVPSFVPGVGGVGIGGVNSHPGKTQDYVPAYESRVANYMADVLKLRLQGNSGGTAEERGGAAHERSADEFLGDVSSGRGPFNKYMQPNEFRNSLISEMGQNIADLKNLRTKAIESVGGKVDDDGHVTGSKNAMDIAARIDRRIGTAQHDLDTWMVAHPEQGSATMAPGNALGAKLRSMVFGPGYAGQ